MISKAAVSIYLSVVASTVTAQSSLSKSFLRAESGDNQNKRYDFTNFEKRTGHLIEKPSNMENEILKAMEENVDANIDIEQYDAMLVEQLDSISMIGQQFTKFDQMVDDTTLICEGEVTLITLDCPQDACDGEDMEKCKGCKASFCMLDFDAQKENPEKYPDLMRLVGESNHCDSQLIAKDFNEIVQECKEYDRQKDAFAGENALPKLLPLAGLITEIGFTDSEFVTNSIISSDPTTRVIVDAQPISETMSICDNYIKNRRKKFMGIAETSICNRNKAADLLKDVVYMLSRTRDSEEERVIIKALPDATQGIDIFDTAFPDVNWMFIYNDPSAEIGAQMQTSRPERANCVKSKADPQPAVREVVEESGLEIESLSLAQYCAASFTSLAKKAVVERSLTNKGTFVHADNALEMLPKVFLDQFHTPDPEGVKASKFADKKSMVASVQQRMHSKKVDLATPEYTQDAESVYGALYAQLQELERVDPLVR